MHTSNLMKSRTYALSLRNRDCYIIPQEMELMVLERGWLDRYGATISELLPCAAAAQFDWRHFAECVHSFGSSQWIC